MAEQHTTESSLQVRRVIKAPRERVYRAFLDPGAEEMRAFAPDAAPGWPMRAELHTFEPKVGGRYRASLIADAPEHKATYTSHGRFIELVPNEKIVETHQWEGEEDAPETTVTITFRDVPGGTEVTILHEGLPGRDATEGHAQGWTEALRNLATAFEEAH